MKMIANRTQKFITLAIFFGLLIIAIPAFAQPAISANQVTKLAKQFDVSPDILSKFGSMNLEEMRSGLGIAKQVTAKGGSSMDEAVNKVLSAAQNGKGWTDIATDFGVDAPVGKGGSVNVKIPGKAKNPRKKGTQ